MSFLEDYDDPYDFESLKKALAETLDFLIVTGRDHGNTKPIKLKLILVDQDRMLAVNYGAEENGELKLKLVVSSRYSLLVQALIPRPISNSLEETRQF